MVELRISGDERGNWAEWDRWRRNGLSGMSGLRVLDKGECFIVV